jgi:hypothetical protein
MNEQGPERITPRRPSDNPENPSPSMGEVYPPLAAPKATMGKGGGPSTCTLTPTLSLKGEGAIGQPPHPSLVKGGGGDFTEGLRKDITALWEKRARGDVSERGFQKQSEQAVLDLCRALVRRRIGEGESIQFEHHAVRAHTKIAGSVLRESDQEFISLLATERRLFRLRALHTPDQPLLFLDGDKDAVDELPYGSASGVTVRTQRRKGQLVAGLVIAGFALLGYSWLQITGTALFLLGIAGALHGLLVPTRWAEVFQQPPAASPPFQIWALRKKSARLLLRYLRQRMQQR